MNIFKKNKFFGFTMPELIIILGVIGVVAAITISITYNNINDITYEPVNKKTVLMISDTLDSMNADQILDQFDNTTDFVNKFSEYISVTKICPSNNLAGCFANDFTYNGDSKNLNDIQTIMNTSSDIVGVVTSNKISMVVAYHNSCSYLDPFKCISVIFDVDSINKNNVFVDGQFSDLGIYNVPVN